MRILTVVFKSLHTIDKDEKCLYMHVKSRILGG